MLRVAQAFAEVTLSRNALTRQLVGMYGLALEAPSTDDKAVGNVQGCCCLVKVSVGSAGC